MKQRLKILLKTLAVLLLLVAVALAPFALWMAGDKTAPVYDRTYYQGLQVQYRHFRSIREPKIVVVGGSGVAFGIDSLLVEQELGVPCANLGHYASYGLPYMLDLCLSGLGKGDTVVLIPEPDPQMYGDYFGAKSILQATEGYFSMRFRARGRELASLAKAYPDYLREKKEYRKSGQKPEPTGVYAADSFDDRGDLRFPRESNIMDGYFQTDSLPVIREDLVTPEFADLVNSFVKKAEKKGASVVFGFPPINALSVKDVTEEDVRGLVSALSRQLDCPVISSLSDRILDPGYFYDSNFHVNDRGMQVTTALLIEDLKRERGDMRPVSLVLPEPLPLEMGETGEERTENGFLYRVSGTGAWVTGLEEEAKQREELTVPAVLGGFPVTRICDGALAETQAVKVTLPESALSLGGSLFRGAPRLKTLVLLQKQLPSVGDTLLSGAPEDVEILVEASLLQVYRTDYFWAGYRDRLH